ncbi:histone chaperone ASF1-like [Phragmites australis]|uniref:histone chaperone ASF1-like n=1 Tax=Phragmites australis TaxID=29695 RepID=UPI002D7785AE|nr:histone chaperone ASF1-like [Phragmites australis]
MASNDDPIFNEVTTACEYKRIKRILGLKYDWSVEVIAQFYATLKFDHEENQTMQWMIEGEISNQIKEYKDKTNMRLRMFEERQKAIYANLRIEPPCSPVASEEDVSEPEVFENPWSWYDEAQATAGGTGTSHAQEIEEESEEEEEDCGGAEESTQDDDDASGRGDEDENEEYEGSN